MLLRVRGSQFASVSLLLLLACSGGSEGDAAESVRGDGDDCAERCLAKAQTCGAQPGQADAVCDDYCDASPSARDLACFEAKSCDALTEEGLGCPAQPGDGGEGDEHACGNGLCDEGETLSSCAVDCQEQTGGKLGDACTCSEPGFACSGTSVGCQFGGGATYSCLVDSFETARGTCTQFCETDDDCDEGSCLETIQQTDPTKFRFKRCI